VPDLTGYITEGQLVLDPELHAKGVYPPFDALGSLSRLMRLGAGPGRTRDDHLEIAAQLNALLARARQIGDLADVVGADALAPHERRCLDFAEAFRRDFLSQGKAEAHSLEETLERAWRAASLMPRRELSMVSKGSLDAHYQTAAESQDAPADAAR
jgi:V/A-type H+-transporting ATPase subunit B